jgi:sugar phosphate isomerase/epimerase
MAKLGIAAQLYTARELLGKDYAGTIQQLAKIGYRNVEMAGYGSLKTAKEVAKAHADAGVRVVGNHVGVDALQKSPSAVFDDNNTLGNKNLIVPWLAEEKRRSADDWMAFARTMSELAHLCDQRGFKLGYHNHSFEFQKFDGKAGFDYFWENAEPIVKSELDVYWVKHGGLDPVAYIDKLGNRVILLHLKDMAAGPERRFAPVGTGILDFKAIIAAGEQVGATYGIVEQDNCYDMAPLEALKISFENLKKIGAA